MVLYQIFRSFMFLELSIFQAATKILARQLIRLRQQITNLQGTRAQIRGVATHTQVIKKKLIHFFSSQFSLSYIKKVDRHLSFSIH